MIDNLDRRQFLQTAGALAAAPLITAAATTESQKKMIGMQIGSVSFLDEGTEKVLDILQERGAVNTLFLAVFTYGRGIAGRQVPGHPLPDHGKQEYDTGFHGGNFATPHPEFYRNTVLKDTKAPDHGSFDVLAEVTPAAKKRGMKTICWLEDVFRKDTPNIEKLQEIDLHGNHASTLCFNNPNYRGFLTGLVEDYARSYEIDGLMWGSERQGALSNAIGASHGGLHSDPGKVTCFCEFCQQKAQSLGINVARAREGFLKLEEFVRAGRAGKRPTDGYYVNFWRLILNYPEIAAWEMLWTNSLRDTYSAIYKTVKTAKPSVPVGWHIWHNNSFNPIYRAEQDLSVLTEYSDYLKMVMYHNCGGERMVSYMDSVDQTIYGDLPKEVLYDFEMSVMNFKERPMGELAKFGLSADSVYRETKRAVDVLAGKPTQVWPGIDIDIPTEARNAQSTPQGTKDAVLAAFHAGAQGVILSRKYSEMKLANLSGAGQAIRELGYA
jgi:hypothetical protein